MVHIILASAVLIALIGQSKSKYTISVSFLILTLFSAVRYNYGSDYPAYQKVYQQIQMGNTIIYQDEPLYRLLNELSPSFYFFIAVTSILFMAATYFLISKNVSKDYAWIGLLIFVINPTIFLINLSALRQCLAMVCFMAAVPLAMKKKWISYCILIVIAMLFHNSAFILLPCYFIINDKPVKNVHVLSFIVCICGLFLLDFEGILRFILIESENASYLHYVNNSAQNSLRATLLTSMYVIYILGNLPKLSGTSLVYSKLSLIGVTFALLAYKMSMLTRPEMYFDIFSVVAIPSILEANQKSGLVVADSQNPLGTIWELMNKYAFPICIFLIYALRYYSFFANPMWREYNTYQTIFSVI